MALDVVTGAFGYSGAAIARDLAAAGRQVRTLTSHPRDDRDIEVMPLDFTDPEQLTRSLDGADTLYNTYWVRFSHGQNTHDLAVRNSRVLFEAAKRAGVHRIVHVSITHPDAGSPYPYFRGKAEVEQHLVSTGTPYTILRPAILFGGDGVLVNNIAWLLRHLPVFAIGGTGEYRIRPIHVDDLASLATGEWTGDVTMDAVGPQSLPFKDMVSAIRAAVGSRAVLVWVPGRWVAPLSAMLGLPLRDVLLTGDEYRAMAAGLADSSAQAAGPTAFTDWVSAHGAVLGRRYASELDRHYRLPPATAITASLRSHLARASAVVNVPDREHDRVTLAAAPVRHPPHQAKAGPVLVDGGDLHVNQPEWQRDRADHVVGDVAAMASRPARPGGPHGSAGVDPLCQSRQLRGELKRSSEECHYNLSRPGSGVGQIGGRFGKGPARRAVNDSQPQARFEPELAGLRHHGVAGGLAGRARSSK